MLYCFFWGCWPLRLKFISHKTFLFGEFLKTTIFNLLHPLFSGFIWRSARYEKEGWFSAKRGAEKNFIVGKKVPIVPTPLVSWKKSRKTAQSLQRNLCEIPALGTANLEAILAGTPAFLQPSRLWGNPHIKYINGAGIDSRIQVEINGKSFFASSYYGRSPEAKTWTWKIKI